MKQSRPQSRRKMRPAPAAFSLVELIVVVAIVAMLAGLVSMQIRSARDRARATHCRNNLRQFGIAMGKYLSDWNGYFIFPGSHGTWIGSGVGIHRSGSSIEFEGIEDMHYGAHYERGLDSAGTPEGRPDKYDGFIANYILSGNSPSSVAHCPEVDQEIFNPRSRVFKGTSEGRYDRLGSNTSYLINCNAMFQHRSDLRAHQFAFIDWNAAQGWLQATVSDSPDERTRLGFNGVEIWHRSLDTVGAAVLRTVYREAVAGAAKGAPSYQTEIGFHHRSGNDFIANYVAMDGHVGSIASNAPKEEFQRLYLGN